MRKLLIIIFYFIGLVVYPNTYYVATTGSDEAAGTLAAPWATWQHAFDMANAGDTVFFRGGTWYPTVAPNYEPGASHGHNGTYGNDIVYMNYPGEIPIIDFTNQTSTITKQGLRIYGVDYVKFIGLTVQNCVQIVEGQYVISMEFNDCGTITLDRVVCRDGGGYGIHFAGYDTLYLINCDSYGHNDPLTVAPSTPGNRSDGFQISSGSDVGDYLYIYGCRSWNNSDDGMEISTGREYHLSNSWFFCNGYLEGGMGTGVKYGSGYLPRNVRVQTNCIAAFNKGSGYTHQNLSNEDRGPVGEFYNNLVYRCQSGYMSAWGSYNCSTGDGDVIFQNNLFYHSTSEFLDQLWPYACQANYPSYISVATYNTFVLDASSPFWEYNTDYGWSYDGEDAQFLDLPDSTECITAMSAARNADGSLPSLGDYFRLALDSDLKGVGVDVGMSETPDIGIDWAYLDGEIDETATDILSFTFDDIVGVAVIDADAHTVTAVLGAGNDISAVTPTFTLSPEATSDPASGVEDDYTNPVTITITGGDEVTEQEWTVTITLDDDPVPVVATVSADYNAVSANITGRIYSANGGTLTARGICYSTTSTTPTLSDRHTTYDPYVGTFTDKIYGLRGGTTYYFRAYGTTSEGGTSYGDAISFTTPAKSWIGGYRINGKPVYIK